VGGGDADSAFVGEASAPRVGDWIDGRYLLVRSLGEGGMGLVFEARHKLMDTAYALKFLKEEYAAQPHLADRFLREARIAGRIDNPHVVRVFDVSAPKGGLPYMVMDLLRGETLHARLRRQRPPLGGDELRDVMLQTLDGVAAAHRLGVVHRDLKPANIMLTRNDAGARVAKVLDFGLAKLLDAESAGGVTEPGTVLGTADYMPPEQAFGQPVDQRADVFALGVIFFELIAGSRPVDAEAPAEIALAYQRRRAKRLQDCVPGVDPRLAAVIHRAIEPRAEDRYESAEAFLAAFREVPPEAILAALPERPPGATPLEPETTVPDESLLALPWPATTARVARSRSPWLLLAAGVTVAVLIALALAWC
jgi:serine/threonine-protein kinase